MQPWRWYVYIIECEDGTYYTGMTWNPSNRWEQHVSLMGSKYTSKHKPKKMVYIEEHEEFDTARYREKEIKDWSRAKKQKLISGEWGKEWLKL